MPDPVDPVLARTKAIVDKLWGDHGEAGKAVRAAAKELFPEIVTPEDTLAPIVEPLRAEIASLRAEREAERAAAAEREAAAVENARQADFETKFQNTVKKFSLSAAGVDALAARIKESGNYASPDDAAAFILKDEKPATAIAPYLGPQDLNFLGAMEDEANLDRLKLLHKDPQGAFLDAEFRDFMADPDKYVADSQAMYPSFGRAA